MSAISREPLEYCRQMMVDFRRDMHQHPELGFEETRTAAKIAVIWQSLGIEGRAGAGVVGSAMGGREFSRQASQTMLKIHRHTNAKRRVYRCGRNAVISFISNERFV